MAADKRVVYILKSESDPNRYYTGLTSTVSARLDAHNAGRCPHTTTGRPWRVDVIVEFSDERRAVAFERYLKSGSGGAFAKHHFRSRSGTTFRIIARAARRGHWDQSEVS